MLAYSEGTIRTFSTPKIITGNMAESIEKQPKTAGFPAVFGQSLVENRGIVAFASRMLAPRRWLGSKGPLGLSYPFGVRSPYITVKNI